MCNTRGMGFENKQESDTCRELFDWVRGVDDPFVRGQWNVIIMLCGLYIVDFSTKIVFNGPLWIMM